MKGSSSEDIWAWSETVQISSNMQIEKLKCPSMERFIDWLRLSIAYYWWITTVIIIWLCCGIITIYMLGGYKHLIVDISMFDYQRVRHQQGHHSERTWICWSPLGWSPGQSRCQSRLSPLHVGRFVFDVMLKGKQLQEIMAKIIYIIFSYIYIIYMRYCIYHILLSLSAIPIATTTWIWGTCAWSLVRGVIMCFPQILVSGSGQIVPRKNSVLKLAGVTLYMLLNMYVCVCVCVRAELYIYI